jgi:hypothetical protein
VVWVQSLHFDLRFPYEVKHLNLHCEPTTMSNR